MKFAKNTIFLGTIASVLLIGTAVSAQVFSNPPTMEEFDAPAGVNSVVPSTVDVVANVNATPSTPAAQDATANVNSNPSTPAAQDATANVNSNPSTPAAQDATANVNSNPGTQDNTTPVTPGGGGNGGGTSGGGPVIVNGGSSSFGGGSFVTLVSTSCPIVSERILGIGRSNDVAQVKNLQSFLKDHEKANVAVTGIFDEQTEQVVMDFQKKYSNTILAPWSATKASGVVYITTAKKINELACGKPLTLNSNELTIINSYVPSEDGLDVELTTAGPSLETSNDNASGTNAITVEAETETAAVANASIWSRFWNFILNLFR
jgi:peptidoglycan hydrolase-like protein with peptidoglycan-binding domain